MIELDKELVTNLVNYLATKPFNEVFQFVPTLVEKLNDGQSPPTVPEEIEKVD